jgi:hypothetical protein
MNSLQTNSIVEVDMKKAHNIYLDYLQDRQNFELENNDEIDLRKMAESTNIYAGYARAIYYELTGEWITVEMPIYVKNRDQNDEHISASEMVIFPNPLTEEKLTIDISSFKSYQNMRIEILDITGKSQVVQKVDQSITEINLDKLSLGLFLIKLYNGKGLLSTEKFIKL